MKGNIRMSAACAVLMGTVLLALSGCAPAWKRGEEYKVTTYPDAPVRTASVTGSSLWDDRGSGYFADHRARKVNDVVTIVVDESAKASKAAGTALSRDSSADLGISAFLGLEKSVVKRNSNMDPAALVSASGKTAFDGNGKTTREETLNTTVTAVVKEILSSGNMLIEARRDVGVNGEKQVMVLHGVIRPEDVDAANSVPSSRVAQARIEYYGEGVISEKQNPGWMTKIIDHLWPF
jgi:flagellar L-ring protein precursor FlgH